MNTPGGSDMARAAAAVTLDLADASVLVLAAWVLATAIPAIRDIVVERLRVARDIAVARSSEPSTRPRADTAHDTDLPEGPTDDGT